MSTEKTLEKGTNKVFDIAKGIVITAIPVVIGLTVYNLFLDKPVMKLKSKMSL